MRGGRVVKLFHDSCFPLWSCTSSLSCPLPHWERIVLFAHSRNFATWKRMHTGIVGMTYYTEYCHKGVVLRWVSHVVHPSLFSRGSSDGWVTPYVFFCISHHTKIDRSPYERRQHERLNSEWLNNFAPHGFMFPASHFNCKEAIAVGLVLYLYTYSIHIGNLYDNIYMYIYVYMYIYIYTCIYIYIIYIYIYIYSMYTYHIRILSWLNITADYQLYLRL
jgi:hypothetical protein